MTALVGSFACGTANDTDIVGGKPSDSGLDVQEDSAVPTDDSSAPTDSALDAPSDTVPSDIITVDVQDPVGETIVYAHDKTSLYKIDPTDPTLKVVKVGDFDCIGKDPLESSMTDLAVDSEGKLYGVSSRALFLDMRIEGTTVKCQHSKVPINYGSLSANDSKFFGLSVAPPTQNLGSSESLIGANTVGDLYKIDKNNGKLTLVGNFGKVPSDDGQGHTYDPKTVGKNWGLSGDLVFLKNEGGTPIGFATVRNCEKPETAPNNTCSKIDTLVEIDVTALTPSQPGHAPSIIKSTRGQILPTKCHNEECGFGSIYGIAAFNDKVFGFVYKITASNDRNGLLISIDNDTAIATLISTPLTTDGFAGAGVSTLAPVKPPPPK